MEGFDGRFDALERRLAEVKADLVRWMFIFVGQIGATLGILFAFFKP